jgi:hypothetical protein
VTDLRGRHSHMGHNWFTIEIPRNGKREVTLSDVTRKAYCFPIAGRSLEFKMANVRNY